MSLAVLAALLLAAAEAPPPEARDLKEAGDRKRAAGDSAGAGQAYRAAVAVFGGYAEAHEALGEVLFAEKRLFDAAGAFEQAVQVDPGLALAWYNLGYTARRLGDLPRAREAWRRYLALRPEDLDARLGLAETLRDLGEREAAIEAFETFTGLAQPAAEEAARVEKARQAVAELRAGAPASGAAPQAPGVTEGEARPGAAIAVPPAPAVPPTTVPAPAAAAPAPAAVVDPAPAAAAPRVPVETAPPPVAPTVPTPSAPVPTPAAPDASPRPAPVIIVPVPSAIPALSEASPAGGPRSGRQAAALQKLRLGDRLLAEGDLRLALFAYQDAVNQDPRSAEARLKLGRVYLRLDHLDEAAEQFSVAAALDPGDAQVRLALEEARARVEGRAPPAGAPVIVRLPPGGSLEPASEPQPAPGQASPAQPPTARGP